MRVVFIGLKKHVLVNVWAISNDPKVWKNFWEFNLDQYLSFDINVWRSNFNLLPFGSSIDNVLV
jgi:cytochrome P450